MRPGQISLIISTYERPDALEKVLRGVQRQTEMPREILVADDGSGAATRDLIAQWQGKLSMPLRHFWQEHTGFRKTIILNKALAAATGEYIVLLDGDCVPHKQFIADHASLAEKNFWVQGRRCFVREKFVNYFAPGLTPVLLWMLSDRITGWAKAIRLPFAFVRRNTGQRGIIGCNMGFWRDDLLAVNGFDEEFIGWGGEDSDIGTRVYHLGRQRKFVYGRAIVYHLDHPMLNREQSKAGFERLAETIRSKRIRCVRGVDQYLAGAPSA
jgi:glycosyltransferase involved in cell wall biosynthesis